MTALAPSIELEDTLATPVPPLRVLPAPRKRILLADDSPQIRESLGKLLRGAGYDVAFAAHGGHVLDLVLNEPIDLLLLDLNMPQMDGWDALNYVNSMQPTLPIVIITAQPDQGAWVMMSGARAIMEKPLNLPLLLQTISEFLAEPPPAQTGSGERQRSFVHQGWPRRQGITPGERPPCGGINE